jgi:hypothetical protein
MKHNLTVGTLLVASWGYDQTNIDAYQVVEVGPSSIKVRAIATEQVPGSNTGGMSCKVRVVKDKFLEGNHGFGMKDGNAPTLLRLTKSGNFRIKGRYSLSVTDEKKEHYMSWYA